MFYTLLAFVFAILAVVIIHAAINMLLANNWFLGWLRGMLGLGLLLLAIVAGLFAFDIYTYKPIVPEQSVATVSFTTIEPQQFNAVVLDRTGKEQRFALRGDQWQLDARMIKWQGFLEVLNVRPGYRLDRLSGRYYDIQKETAESRTTYSITKSILDVDVWRFIHNHEKWFPLVDTNYGSAAYLPMKDGASYEIYSSNTGLGVRPINEIAKSAVSEWH